MKNKAKYKSLDKLGFMGYRVGNDGSVWSRWRLYWATGGRGGFKSIADGEWRQLAPGIDNTGHLKIGLMKTGKRYFKLVHRLVLQAFVGPCPKNMQCRHLDNNPKNNNIENLKWDTAKNNCKDRSKTSWINNIHKGSKHYRSKNMETYLR